LPKGREEGVLKVGNYRGDEQFRGIHAIKRPTPGGGSMTKRGR